MIDFDMIDFDPTELARQQIAELDHGIDPKGKPPPAFADGAPCAFGGLPDRPEAWHATVEPVLAVLRLLPTNQRRPLVLSPEFRRIANHHEGARAVLDDEMRSLDS